MYHHMIYVTLWITEKENYTVQTLKMKPGKPDECSLALDGSDLQLKMSALHGFNQKKNKSKLVKV